MEESGKRATGEEGVLQLSSTTPDSVPVRHFGRENRTPSRRRTSDISTPGSVKRLSGYFEDIANVSDSSPTRLDLSQSLQEDLNDGNDGARSAEDRDASHSDLHQQTCTERHHRCEENGTGSHRHCKAQLISAEPQPTSGQVTSPAPTAAKPSAIAAAKARARHQQPAGVKRHPRREEEASGGHATPRRSRGLPGRVLSLTVKFEDISKAESDRLTRPRRNPVTRSRSSCALNTTAAVSHMAKGSATYNAKARAISPDIDFLCESMNDKLKLS